MYFGFMMFKIIILNSIHLLLLICIVYHLKFPLFFRIEIQLLLIWSFWISCFALLFITLRFCEHLLALFLEEIGSVLLLDAVLVAQGSGVCVVTMQIHIMTTIILICFHQASRRLRPIKRCLALIPTGISRSAEIDCLVQTLILGSRWPFLTCLDIFIEFFLNALMLAMRAPTHIIIFYYKNIY